MSKNTKKVKKDASITVGEKKLIYASNKYFV